MSRRLVLRLSLLTVVVLLVTGAAGTWYYSTTPDYRLQQGQDAARNGDLVRAEEYVRLLESAGAADHAHVLKGEIALARNAVSQAIGHYSRIKDQSPLFIRATFLAAKCHVLLRRPREAERLFGLVMERQRDHVDAHRFLAVIYFDQGDYSRALPHLEEVARLDPKDSRPHRTMGLIYKELDDFDRAVSAYEEMLRRGNYPGNLDEVRLEHAECLMQQYKEEAAVKALGELNTPAAIALRAEAMIVLGQEQAVIELLDATLRKYPDEGALLRLRGERFLAANQNAEAARMLERVVAKNLNDSRSHSGLGLAYSRLGRDKDAKIQNDRVKEIQKLLSDIHDQEVLARRDPWDPAPRLELANLLDKMNRPEMVKMWRRAADACRRGSPPGP